MPPSSMQEVLPLLRLHWNNPEQLAELLRDLEGRGGAEALTYLGQLRQRLRSIRLEKKEVRTAPSELLGYSPLPNGQAGSQTSSGGPNVDPASIRSAPDDVDREGQGRKGRVNAELIDVGRTAIEGGREADREGEREKLSLFRSTSGRKEQGQPREEKSHRAAPHAESRSLTAAVPAATPLRVPPDEREGQLVWQPFHSPRLPAASSLSDYELHLAAIEWGLDPAILIQSAEDIQSRSHWSDIFKPYEHQVRNLITFCRRAPVALIADDVGLGKTISAGLIISELMARGKVKRVLVIAPKLLLPQWQGELVRNFQIKTEYGVSDEVLALSRKDVSVVVTTYDSARGRLDRLAESGRFDMLVLDEAHKLRNLHSQGTSPVVARVMKETLARRAFRYVLMLTATPIHNRLWDIYSLVDLLATAKGHENPFGSPDSFANRYIADSRATGRVLNSGRREEFRRHLSQYMVRTRRADCDLPFPQRVVRTIKAKGDPAERELIDLVGSEIKDCNALVQISLAQALMSSPQALLEQLKHTGRTAAHAKAQAIASRSQRTGKERKLLELVEQLRAERSDWRVLIFTGRLETQAAIGRLLSERFGEGLVGFIKGGSPKENQRAIHDFFESPPKVHVIVSTDSGAEGVNLQAGNVVVNYDLPWNPMLLEQRIGRVQRLGSHHAAVSVLNLVLEGSVEEHVVGRLTEKLATIAETLGDVEGILESLSTGDEESLEKEIRQLVVASLVGQDINHALERMQASVDRARAIYEEERKNVEASLGSLDAMHRDGPLMPKLAEVEPRLSEIEFTKSAMRAEGGQLQERSDGSLALSRPGRASEVVIFDEQQRTPGPFGAFGGGSAVRLYRSGQPAFEQLVGRWSSRSGHHLLDVGVGEKSKKNLRDLVASWKARFPGLEIVRSSVGIGSAEFQGRLAVRISASVAHDKYEKLLEIDVRPLAAEHDSDEHQEEGEVASGEVTLSEVLPSGEDTVKATVAADGDFRAFTGFYLERLSEELLRAGADPKLADLARNSFRPAIAAEVVGIRGVRKWSATVDLTYSIDGEGTYSSRLELLPGRGLILSAPEAVKCEATGRDVPADAIARSEISKKSVLRHLLHASEKSGRLGLPAETTRCGISGRMLLIDEVGTCEVTGVAVDNALLGLSEVSKRSATLDKLVKCDFTGALVLPEELEISQVSGRGFRKDQSRIGEVPFRELSRHGLNVIGHVSEFSCCEESGSWFTEQELGRSDLSGKRVQSRLLIPSEKNPGRKGLVTEMSTCAQSGLKMLSDEVGLCTATGKTVDRELLLPSGVSGKLALLSEMVSCELTGTRLLPSEAGKCCLTGTTVDARQLQSSELSGLSGLRERLVTCAVTGKRVFPFELVQCEATGLKVIPDALRECSVTGKRVIERSLVQSAVSGNWILKEIAVLSATSNRPCAPGEAVTCEWEGRPHLPTEMGACSWTGMRVAKGHLAESGVLLPLRDLLERSHPGEALPSELSAYLSHGADLVYRKLKGLRCLKSPDGRCFAVVGEQKSLLGLRVRDLGVIVRRASDFRIMGLPVVGKRNGEHWYSDLGGRKT